MVVDMDKAGLQAVTVMLYGSALCVTAVLVRVDVIIPLALIRPREPHSQSFCHIRLAAPLTPDLSGCRAPNKNLT